MKIYFRLLSYYFSINNKITLDTETDDCLKLTNENFRTFC